MKNESKILIIEDDMLLNDMTKRLLTQHGYCATSAYSGSEALLLIERSSFDLILLDLMLPGIPGEIVLEKIKNIIDIPIIGVSAKTDIDSKVNLIRNGADDYITKPFDNQELLVRIEAVLRRFQKSTPKNNRKTLRFKDLSLDTEAMEAKIRNTPITLTRYEYLILQLLMSSPSKVFTKNNIFESVWNENFIGDDNAINDLRTPLATANGYIQLLQEQDLTGEQKEYATIAGERISAVKLLLDQLFEFARIEADELKLNCRNTDIHSVLRDVVASYYGDFEQKKCVPYIVIPNPPAIIWGDPDALTRIFSNVVYNALVHGEGNYQITAAIEEAQTVITIKNASSSIQQEDIPHLFDRFYTTDQSRTKKTTGLGLAIAQRLVTRMGGQIVASLQNGIFAIQVVFPIVNS